MIFHSYVKLPEGIVIYCYNNHVKSMVRTPSQVKSTRSTNIFDEINKIRRSTDFTPIAISDGKPMETHMVFPWFSQHFPMIFRCFRMEKIWTNPSEAIEVFGQVVAPPAVGHGARNPRCDFFWSFREDVNLESTVRFHLNSMFLLMMRIMAYYGKDGSFEIWQPDSFPFLFPFQKW